MAVNFCDDLFCFDCENYFNGRSVGNPCHLQFPEILVES